VEKLEGGWSRVYYSADSQLPSWVPGFAKDRLIGQALRQSTSWVDKYAQLAVGTSGVNRPPVVLVLLRRLLVAAALVQAKVKMLPKLLPGIWLPPVVGRTADSALLALRGLLSRLKALRAPSRELTPPPVVCVTTHGGAVPSNRGTSAERNPTPTTPCSGPFLRWFNLTKIGEK